MMDELPPVMDAQQLGMVLGVSEGSLAQDRYRGTGIPFVKLNKKVRYLREDVLDHFMRNRMFRTDGAVPGECIPDRRAESTGTGASQGSRSIAKPGQQRSVRPSDKCVRPSDK